MNGIDLRPNATISHAGRQLRMTSQRAGSAVLLYAAGTVDACNVAVWRRLIGTAARSTPTPGLLIVETGQLEFMGCCAFVVLAEESARCRRRGIKLCLVSRQSITARVLAAAGFQTELPLYPSVDAALGEPQPPPTVTNTTGAGVAS